MYRMFTALIMISIFGFAFADVEGVTPVGVWRVLGDKSGEAEALVRITEHDGIYEGRIISLFPRPGVSPDVRCDECTGPRKNLPVKGLVIMTGLRRVGAEYTGGEILDPESGDLYQCSLKVSVDNRKVFVRGFIGISLLGRTQTWLRE